MVSVTDDHGQSVNAFPQIHISAGEYNPAVPAASLSMTDHLEDPVKQGFRNIVRYRNG